MYHPNTIFGRKIRRRSDLKPIDIFQTEAIALFDKYREHFGLGYGIDLEKQCDFEDEFCNLICKYNGHKIIQDQCGKPEHDFCIRCNRRKTEIENASN